MIERFGLKIRRACKLTGLWRSTRGYEPKPDPGAEKIRVRLKELAEKRSTWGCPMLHAIVKREGLVVNHNGRRFKSLMIVDDCTRESPAIETDTSIPGARVVRVLDQLKETRGLPKVIVVDNGPEFSGRVLDDWAWRNGAKLHFIDPGKPVQNPYIESFNATFRKDCPNQNWFYTLEEAREEIEKWRQDYNDYRPHSSLADLSPSEFIKQFSLTKNTQRLNSQVAQLPG